MKKAKKPFKDLLGGRIILENFATGKAKDEAKKGPNSGILLLGDDQKNLDADKMDKALASTVRFTILQLGDDCNPKFKEGQEVYVENPERILAPGSSMAIMEDGEILGFIIPERAIAGIF